MDNSSVDRHTQLVRYLDNEMTELEKQAFQSQLRDDISLQKDLEQVEAVRHAVRLYGISQLVTSVHQQTVLAETTDEKIPVRRIAWYSLAVAAAVVFLIIGIKTFTGFSVSSDRLFAEHYSSYTLSTVRGNSSITEVEQLYLAKKFKQIAEQPLNMDSASAKTLFLTGIANMETQNYGRAASLLTLSAQADSSSVIKDASQYYLALALLKTNKLDESKSILTKIAANPDHLYHNRVTDSFLQSIEKLEKK